MIKFWIGTSGYNYPEWRGSFYPRDLASKKMLSYYGHHFSTVEINYTFYRMPTPKTLTAWANATPAHFVFSLKAPRRITHELKLHDAADPLGYFCRTASFLENKLGPLLFQLPPYMKKDLPLLEDFLSSLPQVGKPVMEFRHSSWFTDDVCQCLQEHGVALCIADTEKGTSPWEYTASFGYIRMRGENYSEDGIAEWAARLRKAAANWSHIYIYLKHESEGKGALQAVRLQEELQV